MTAQRTNLPQETSLTHEKPSFQLTQVAKGVQDYITGISTKLARIERNKDKLNFAPALDFLEQNLTKYEDGLNAIFAQDPNNLGMELSDRVKIIGEQDRIGPQISVLQINLLIDRMPESLGKLSRLGSVNFHTVVDEKGNGHPIIPIPGFDDDGNFDPEKVTQLKPDDFPRKKGFPYTAYTRDGMILENTALEDDHPKRILVGMTIGDTIYPTPIPSTLSDNHRAIEIYQICVFLHEFFHTVEEQYRTYRSNTREKVVLKYNEQEFTLADWWKKWEDLYLQDQEGTKVTSYYASTYSSTLNQATRDAGGWEFEYALGEQIAEAFVGYMLNIQANPYGINNFQEGYPREYALMHQLCAAQLVSKL